jgi:hypothetical protein
MLLLDHCIFGFIVVFVGVIFVIFVYGGGMFWFVVSISKRWVFSLQIGSLLQYDVCIVCV